MRPTKVTLAPLVNFAAKIIGGEKLVQQVNHSSLIIPSLKTQARTDIWLKEATVKRNPKHLNKALGDPVAEISLQTVLRTLRKLRLSNDSEPYFILLNRLQSSQVKWISKSGSYVVGQIPLEIYTEISHMLRMKSHNVQHQDEFVCLTKFTFKLLRDYNRALERRETAKPSLAFLQNCADVIVRTGSINDLHVFEHLVADDVAKCYANIAFHLQTNQIAHLISYLDSKVFPDVNLNFSSTIALLLRCISKFIVLGMEDVANNTLKFALKQNVSTVRQMLSDIKYISEKHGALKVQLTLKEANLREDFDIPVPWKTFQKELTFADYINLFHESGIDFYKETAAMDFLLTKLPTYKMSPSQWCQFYEETKPRQDASDSLKAFHLNTIMCFLGSNGSLGLVTLIWCKLMRDSTQAGTFINTHKLDSYYAHSGFHVLIRAVGKSSAAKLAGYEIFKFLKSGWVHQFFKERCCTFEFSSKDYYYLMCSTVRGRSYHAIYYYLFHYYLDLGASCLHRVPSGELSWQMDTNIERLLSKMFPDDWKVTEIGRLTQKVGEWFLANSSSEESASKIPKSVLLEIFGSLYVPELTSREFINLESRSANSSVRLLSYGEYSLIADWENAQRVRATLDNLTSFYKPKD